jgi:signal transduction histidine kinase
MEMVRPVADERGIHLESDLAFAEALGDEDRFRQVITNLLTNAIHYNREHGEVYVSTRAESGSVVLRVSNTGPGIAQADLPHIFERFYRADKSRGRAEGRSGLGLAICKAVVNAHGGAIDVSSGPGAGATFTVRLPAAR